MNRVKLSEKSFGELNKLRLTIENELENQQSGFHKLKPYPRKRVEDIAWAVTYKLAREREER